MCEVSFDECVSLCMSGSHLCPCYFFLFYFLFVFGCAQDLFLVFYLGIMPGMFGGPYEVPGIEPRAATCKADTLPTLCAIT